MEYGNYAERIQPFFDFETYKKPKFDAKEVVRISVKKGEITTHKIIKTKFSTRDLLSKRNIVSSFHTFIFERT